MSYNETHLYERYESMQNRSNSILAIVIAILVSILLMGGAVAIAKNRSAAKTLTSK